MKKESLMQVLEKQNIQKVRKFTAESVNLDLVLMEKQNNVFLLETKENYEMINKWLSEIICQEDSKDLIWTFQHMYNWYSEQIINCK